jgi:succinate dehydrogenase / fumarate reductase, cytochrome b subunit
MSTPVASPSETAPTPRVLTPLALYHSTIGKKVAMAVTGIALWGYVVFHMLGNLKIFTGARHFDEYAAFLREIGKPILDHGWFLWGARSVLLASVVIHIVAATQLSIRNANARKASYTKTEIVQASYASRTMRWGGVIILLFVIYHVLHLTTGTLHNDFHHGAPYGNVVAGFQFWWVSAAYILAVIAVGLHLYHGTWSMFQTLGRNRPGLDPYIRRFSQALAVVVTLGYIAVPVGVMTGVVS